MVTFSSRGAVERVCRRWRRLCLATFPCTAAIRFDQGLRTQSAAHCPPALEHISAALRLRHLQELELSGCYDGLPLPLPAVTALAAATFPTLRRLKLKQQLLSTLVAFLPLCCRLESLSINHSSMLDAAKWEELVKALRTLVQLRQLDLSVFSSPCAALAAALQQLPRLQGISLDDYELSEAPWLPHLRDLDVWLDTAQQGQLLAQAILPGLVELECTFSVPQQAWYCRHLTALTCWHCHVDSRDLLPAADMQLDKLRRLQLRGASDEDCFPAQLCALPLTSLLWMEEDCCDARKSLPPDFSRLSTLQQLAINGLPLSQQGLAPLASLSALTELHLPDCPGKGDCLPRGPYLRRLLALDISGLSSSSDALLPPAVPGATALRALCASWCPLLSLLADWPKVKEALSKLRRLQVLSLPGMESWAGAATRQGLLSLFREHFPLKVHVAEADVLNRYPHLSSLAEDVYAWEC
ncbi:hypothetical protein ABPG75_008440 [Micractinium tetrahymenae]